MNKDAWTSPILTSTKTSQMSNPRPLRSLCSDGKNYFFKSALHKLSKFSPNCHMLFTDDHRSIDNSSISWRSNQTEKKVI